MLLFSLLLKIVLLKGKRFGKDEVITVVNSDELKRAMKSMRQDIETIIIEMALYQSGFMIAKVSEIRRYA